MKATNSLPEMIAPCGMNCSVCYGYLRTKNTCNGCRSKEGFKPAYCERCIIVNCEKLATTGSGFCYDCDTFPCKRLKALDKRYRTKYRMSMLENLGLIRDRGMDYFLRFESDRWTCKECGGVVCVHSGKCISCGKIRIV